MTPFPDSSPESAPPPEAAPAATPSAAPGWLSRVRIVLVGTQHPGNIGAAARAMKNMGLADLALVSPHRFPDPRADAMASNATDLLATATVHADLASALQDCARVYATTARSRSLAVPVVTPREAAEQLRSGSFEGRVAVLFGRERTGLTNAELDFAQQIIAIPTAAEYPSLNIAAAVQIVSYELGVAGGAQAPAGEPHVPVAQADMERFYTHLEQVLVQTRFLNPDNPRLLMRRLRRLYARAAPDANEMNILRGMLTAVQDTIRRGEVP